MASPSIQVTGLKEFRRDLKRLEPNLDKQLAKDIKIAAEKAAITAGALAPRVTGALAQSIRPYVSGVRASIGSTLPYAGVVHWGGTISPRGVPITFKPAEFITRAIADHTGELVNDIANGIERAAHETGWH